MAYMYILKCRDGSFYVGSTRNIENRLAQHASGCGSEYTKRRLPVELVYVAIYPNIGEAFAAEKQVQNWSRRKRIALIEGRFSDLPQLARKDFSRERPH
ncbi:GIY-YIG nuclease family protein [Rarobacter incanus]|uniref:Putative endonuclease n=1 Tax=Rarobacter incanus TaxID=153494 RepID=A0A542SN95_9MICO|nr:GIY-YIG nuclease family protein [Rarobacter incanus]TQK75727.1 putative endonuclease [Rarobacter incanus]